MCIRDRRATALGLSIRDALARVCAAELRGLSEEAFAGRAEAPAAPARVASAGRGEQRDARAPSRPAALVRAILPPLPDTPAPDSPAPVAAARCGGSGAIWPPSGGNASGDSSSGGSSAPRVGVAAGPPDAQGGAAASRGQSACGGNTPNACGAGGGVRDAGNDALAEGLPVSACRADRAPNPTLAEADAEPPLTARSSDAAVGASDGTGGEDDVADRRRHGLCPLCGGPVPLGAADAAHTP